MKRTRFGIFWATLLLALLAAAPAAIGAPYNLAPIYPPDTATDVSMLPKLKWSGETTPGNLIYKVYLDIDGDYEPDIIHKVGLYSSGAKAKWRIPMKYALAPDTVHHWRVLAKDTDTWEKTLSDWWEFTTASYPYVTSVAPPVARPTYLVWLEGANFGSDQGAVKMTYRAVVGYTGDDPPEPIYAWLTKLVDGDFGKIAKWTDTEVVIQLAHPAYWSNLPQTVKIKVRPQGSFTWSNKVKLNVEWGGGGWTGMDVPSGSL